MWNERLSLLEIQKDVVTLAKLNVCSFRNGLYPGYFENAYRLGRRTGESCPGSAVDLPPLSKIKSAATNGYRRLLTESPTDNCRSQAVGAVRPLETDRMLGAPPPPVPLESTHQLITSCLFERCSPILTSSQYWTTHFQTDRPTASTHARTHSPSQVHKHTAQWTAAGLAEGTKI